MSKVTTYILILMKCIQKIYRIVTVLVLLDHSDIRRNFEQPLNNLKSYLNVFLHSAPPHPHPPHQGGDDPSIAKRWLCSTKPSWTQTEHDTPITTSELFCCLASPTVPLCQWVGGSPLLRELLSSAPLCLENNKHQWPLRAVAGWSGF